MSSPFADCYVCLRNAVRRVDDVKRLVTAFNNSNPYAVVAEVNAHKTKEFHKLKLTLPLPEELVGVISEAMGHLRSALNVAGYATAFHRGKARRHADFPIGNDPADIAGRHNPKRGKSRDIPREIFDVMAGLKPYPGGNDALVAVQRINNTSKHEFVVRAIPKVSSMIIGELRADADFFTSDPVWDRTHQEACFLCVPRGSKPKYKIEVSLTVAVEQINGLPSYEVAGLLDACVREVRRSLILIRRKAHKIRLFRPPPPPWRPPPASH